jgi:hypothetical protein
MELAGLEDGSYVFRGGRLLVATPAVTIGGQIGAFLVDADPAGAAPALAPMDLLWAVEAGNADDQRSEWAHRAVEGGWFGDGLGAGDLARIIAPGFVVMTGDVGLVEATSGFTRAAEVPATVLLTMLTRPDAGCGIDLNHDGVLDFFDVQIYLALFSAGDAQADINGDGFLDFFDILEFLQRFASGCA